MTNMAFDFETGARTDVGVVRSHNEDSYLALDGSGIWLVADGMGGHTAGDYASQTIVGMMSSVGVPATAQDLEARFMERLVQANANITGYAEQLGNVTVGATMVALLIYDDEFSCIWSGDSRIYLLRDGQLTQQTKDHTEVRQLLEAGAITPEEAVNWPRKNVITRAIGASDTPDCDKLSGGLLNGDTFLLCSDGLTEHLTDDELAMIVQNRSAQDACDALISATLNRGAKDNVTAIVVRCHEAMPPEPEDMEANIGGAL